MATEDLLLAYFDETTVSLLVEAFSGQELLIPAKESGRPWERLVATLGDDRARVVVKHFGGERLAMPVAKDDRPENVIRALRRSGKAINEIAQMTFVRRYSARQIHRILAAEK